MTTNTRHLLNAAGSTRRQRFCQRIVWGVLCVAFSGCAELQSRNAEENPAIGDAAETKLQPGPALPGRSLPSATLPPVGITQAAGVSTGVGVGIPNLSTSTAIGAATDPPREASRTYVGTGNFVNQNPPALTAAAGAEEFTLNF